MRSTGARAIVRVAPILAVLALLLLAPLGTSSLARQGPMPSLPSASGAPGTAVPSVPVQVHAASTSAAPPARSAGSASGCARPSSEFASMWGGAWPPPTVSPTLEGACAWGTDESSLSFLSNASHAADRAAFGLLLPPPGTASGQSLADLSIRLWAAGVPCSLDGVAEVAVELIPPSSPYSANFSADWSVRAPAYDLAPASACDPICSNDTALFAVDGAPFCEDQIVREVAGAPPLTPTGSFAPGDQLVLTFLGNASGAAPLEVFVNDTTHPAQDLAFSYAATSLVTDAPLVPHFAEANLGGSVWGLSPGISAVAVLCPEPGAASASCFSYNASTEAATSPVTITSAESWDATNLSYSDPYDAVATASSSEACGSVVNATSPILCNGFTTPAGGFYPFWTLDAVAGAPAWQFGAGYPGELAAYGGTGSPDDGTAPTYSISTALAHVTGGNYLDDSIYVTGTAADPSGVARVVVGLDYCPGPGSVASVTTKAELGSALASPWLGTFNLSFPFSNPVTSIWPFWVSALSDSGHATSPVLGTVNAGGGATCTVPDPTAPTMDPANVTSTASGYDLHWYDVDPSVTGYVVTATLVPSNGSTETLTLGNVSATAFPIGSTGQVYQFTVTAVSGLGVESAPSAAVTGPTILSALTLTEVHPFPAAAWLGQAALNATGVVSGGLGPYTVSLEAGDGSLMANSTASGNFTILHDYGTYWGTTFVRLLATDAVGDVASEGPWVLSIFATPLGAAQIVSAGELVVNVSYAVPPSEVSALTGFTIVYTTNASLAWELEAGYASNASVPGILTWNTTKGFAEIDAADGVPFFAQVVARNAYGVGWLPPGGAVLEATPAALSISAISAIPGGRAPFTDNVSAWVTGGTNDTITRAIYSFPPNNIVTPTTTEVNGTTYLNATLTFPSPGLFVVVLHATDLFFGTAIQTVTIAVAPGAGPALSGELLTEPAYVDAPLSFQASATGGSGQYAWNWSFGDGNFSSLPDPLHSYALSGGYNLVLTVRDEGTGGFNVTTLPIVVYALPVLFVSVTPGPNGTLSYDFHAAVGGGSGASTVVWTFGDGGVARGVTVSHDFRTAGTYLVNVTATDPAGRSGTTQFNLSAFPTPGGGTGSSSGLTSLDVTLIILVVGFGILALLLAVRRPAAPAPSAGESEDGEVSLP